MEMGIYELVEPTIGEVEEIIEELEEVIEECFDDGANDEADEYISQLHEAEELLEEISNQ